jgi:hypothetical protein
VITCFSVADQQIKTVRMHAVGLSVMLCPLQHSFSGSHCCCLLCDACCRLIALGAAAAAAAAAAGGGTAVDTAAAACVSIDAYAWANEQTAHVIQAGLIALLLLPILQVATATGTHTST